MKSSNIILLLYCIFQLSLSVSGVTFLTPPHPSRKRKGCYEPDVGHLKSGEEKQVPNKCMSASCLPDHSILYSSCSENYIYDESCFLNEDPTKPYPQCCPEHMCD